MEDKDTGVDNIDTKDESSPAKKTTIVYFGAGFDLSPLMMMLSSAIKPRLYGIMRMKTVDALYKSTSATPASIEMAVDKSIYTLQSQKTLVCVDPINVPEEMAGSCSSGKHHMSATERLISWVALCIPEKPDHFENDEERGILTWKWGDKSFIYYTKDKYLHKDTPFMSHMKKEHFPKMGVLYSCNLFISSKEFFDEWMKPAPIVMASFWYFDTRGCTYKKRQLDEVKDPIKWHFGSKVVVVEDDGILVKTDESEEGRTFIQYYDATELEDVYPVFSPCNI